MTKQISKTEESVENVVDPIDKLDNYKRQFVEDYRELRGHITDTCRANGIVRQTYYNWLDSNPDFALAIAEAEAELNDDMRKALIDKGADGDLGAIIFYLKNRHPDFKPQPQMLQQINVGDKSNEIVFVNFKNGAES